MPPIVTINLEALLSTSVLVNMGPLPSRSIMQQNVASQEKSLLC